jgi:phytoene/squalene synthetase
MKQIFDNLSQEMSRVTTLRYSTSFSMGIRFLHKDLHKPIYSIYGFVRFADEIVDSFHGFDKEKLLADFKKQTYNAIDNKISLNPILNSFQWVVNTYDIPLDLIETFLNSMEMDLDKNAYDKSGYEEYILGSAEVVGLMCLKVFVEGDESEYLRLKPFAMKLG